MNPWPLVAVAAAAVALFVFLAIQSHRRDRRP